METTQPRPLTADQVRIDARSRQARRLVKKLDWLHWVLIGIVAWLGFTLWVEPYRYLKLGQFPVRVSRISGATERLFGTGWKPMEPMERPAAAPRTLEEYKKLRAENIRKLAPDEPLDSPSAAPKTP